MKNLSTVLVATALVLVLSFGAFAAEYVIIDTDFSTRFHTDTGLGAEDLVQAWGTSTQAWIDVDYAAGQLRLGGFQSGSWDNNQLGLVLSQPIDLTGRTTIIEIDYANVTVREMNPAFAGAIYHGEDIYGYNGFRLTVSPTNVLSAILSGGDGSFSGLNANISYPAKLRWTLTHVSGKNFNVTVHINDNQVYQGSLNVGSLDPSKLYFYLYASTDSGGEAAINAFRVVQQ